MRYFFLACLFSLISSCNWDINPKLKRGSDLDEWITVDEQYPDSTDKIVIFSQISTNGFYTTKRFEYHPSGILSYAELIGQKSLQIRFSDDGQVASMIQENKDSSMVGPFLRRNPSLNGHSVIYYSNGKPRSEVSFDSTGAFKTISYFPHNAEELYIQFDSIGDIEIITKKGKGIIYDNGKK